MQINNMPDLNYEVDYKALLGLISTLSIFVTKINDIEAAERTINILGILIHADHESNRKYLVDTCNHLLQKGQETQSANLVEFASTLRITVDILVAEGFQYADQWKAALISKLRETRTTLKKIVRARENKSHLNYFSNKKAAFFNSQHRENDRYILKEIVQL